jgi:vanillate/4-hydroxybenzoate decarboxylase subunit D
MTCPRCDSNDASQVFEAHDQSWRIYRCPRCNFNWRSTEPDDVKDSRLYDPRFKLKEEGFKEMVAKPRIPPLREGN